MLGEEVVGRSNSTVTRRACVVRLHTWLDEEIFQVLQLFVIITIIFMTCKCFHYTLPNLQDATTKYF